MQAIWNWWCITSGILSAVFVCWYTIMTIVDVIEDRWRERQRKNKYLCLRCSGAGYIHLTWQEQHELEERRQIAVKR